MILTPAKIKEPKFLETMYREHDRKAIKFWLEQEKPDMNNLDQWIELANELRTMNVKVNTTKLKMHWLNHIDPWMEKAYSVSIKSREELGFDKDLKNNTEKFKVLTVRLILFKRALAEKEEQSSSDDDNEVEVLPSSSKVDKTIPKKSPLKSTPRVIPESGLPRRAISTVVENVEEYKLEGMDTLLPRKFQKCKKNSRSVDIRGFRLPEQVFKDKRFYLLETEADALYSLGLVYGMEYTIKVHGGKILVDPDDIRTDSIVIAAYDKAINKAFAEDNKWKIYSSEMIFYHAKESMYITDETLQCFEIDFNDSKGVLQQTLANLGANAEQTLTEQAKKLEGLPNDENAMDVQELDEHATKNLEKSKAASTNKVDQQPPASISHETNENSGAQEGGPTPSKKARGAELTEQRQDSNAGTDQGKKKMRVFGIMFKLSTQYNKKKTLIENTVATYKNDYKDEVPFDTVKSWIRRMECVSHEYSLLKEEFSLTEENLKAMIELVGYDKIQEKNSSDNSGSC